MADDLLEEKYQDTAVIQEEADHISLAVRNFINNMTRDDVYRESQEMGFSWGPCALTMSCRTTDN